MLPDHHRRGGGRRCGSAGTTAVPFVPRGSGTGLAGGATPAGEVPPVVIVTTKMNRILEVDPDQRLAWVQPGRAQPRPVPGRRPPRPAFRPRPVQPAVVLGRRQPGQQLGRSPLPAVRRHQRPHPGRRGRAPRRRRSWCWAASTPSPTGWTCGVRSSAARAPWASPPASRCG